jgi:gas vesicle protein
MKEKNRDILKRAIEQLPEFKAGKHIRWEQIAGKLERDSMMVSKLKNNLPQFSAPENLWEKIEIRMEAQSPVLSQAIEELPDFKAPADSWNRIKEKMETSANRARKINLRIVTKVAAAAIILVSIGLGSLHLKNRRPDNSIQDFRSTESSGFPSEMNVGINSIYNPSLCKSNPQICDTELFKLLDQQRSEIEAEIQNMESMIKDGDPQLMKYYHRLVNKQVEIEKRMVKLIIES